MSKFISFFVIVLLTFSFVSCDEGEDNPYMKDKEDYPQEIQDYCEDMWHCVKEEPPFFKTEEGDAAYPWTDEVSCRVYMDHMRTIHETCSEYGDDDCSHWERANYRCYQGFIWFWEESGDEHRCDAIFDTDPTPYYDCYPEGYEFNDEE